MSSLKPSKLKHVVDSECEKCGGFIFVGWPHKCILIKPKPKQ
jgi:hypothetical protein